MSQPDGPQDIPFSMELEPGDYFWCACGKSNIQPLCDGSHKDTGIEPLKFTVVVKKTYSLCGCKKTTKPPYCDGSHNKR